MTQLPKLIHVFSSVLLFCATLNAADKQPGNIAWFNGSFEQALVIAKKENKPVFVYFSAHWCLPCVALKSELFPNSDFDALMKNQYIPYYMDFDAPGSQAWFQKFEIPFIPHIVVLSPDGKELMRPSTVAGPQKIIDTLKGSAKLKRSLESIAEEAAKGGSLTLSDDEWKLIVDRITTSSIPLLKSSEDTLKAYASLYMAMPVEKKDLRKTLLTTFLSAQAGRKDQVSGETQPLVKDFEALFDDLGKSDYPDMNLAIIALMIEKPEAQKPYQDRLLAALDKWRKDHASDKSMRAILHRIDSWDPALSLAQEKKTTLTPTQMQVFLKSVEDDIKAMEALTPAQRDVVGHRMGNLLISAKQFDKAEALALREIARGSEHKEKFLTIRAAIAKEKGDKLGSRKLRLEAYDVVPGRSTKLMSGLGLVVDGPELGMSPEEVASLLERTFSEYFKNDDSVEGWDLAPMARLLGTSFETKDKVPKDYWTQVRSRMEKDICRGKPNCTAIVRALGVSPQPPKMVQAQVVNMSLGVYDKDRLGVYFENKEGWHTYAKKADQIALPMAISTHSGTEVISADAIEGWPATIQFVGIDGEKATGYSGRYGFFITMSEKLRNALQSADGLRVDVKWLACKDICIPGTSSMTAHLSTVGTLTTEPLSFAVALSEAANWLAKTTPASELPSSPESLAFLELIAILGLALLGGFILNFMPCVLPVISIKLFSLVKQRDESRRVIVKHSLAYTAGVLVSFLALAMGVIVLKITGASVGWGFQLQSPVFVAVMILVVFVMMLSFFGLFEFKALGVNFLDRKVGAGSFGNGLLATLLATPCSAPFLGTALAFAFLASPPMIVLVFIFVGIGLSAPFLLIAAFPSMLRILPKPGAWMEQFRRILGMFMGITLVWLIDVYTSLSVGPDRAFWLSLTLLFCFFALYGWQRVAKGLLGRTLLVALFVGSLVPLARSLNESEEQTGLSWQKWSPEAQAQAVLEGKTVFVDFTAEWCVTCKYNEKLYLDTTAFAELVQKENIVVMKADYTRSDKVIAGFLQAHGKPGVPAYFVQTPDKGLIDLGSLLSPGALRDALSHKP